MPATIKDSHPQGYQALYETLLMATTDVVVIMSSQFIICDMNAAAEKIFGYKKSEAIHQPFAALLKKFSIESPIIQNVDQLRRGQGMVVPFTTVKNSTVNSIIHWNILLQNAIHGDDCLIILTGRDVTEIEKSNKQIKFLHQLIQDLPAIVYWKDLNSVYLGCNNEFVKNAGVKSSADVIGKVDEDFPWKSQAAAFKKDDQYVMQTNQKKSGIEECCENWNLDKKSVITSKAPLKDVDGKIFGVVGITTDISDLIIRASHLENFKDTIQYIVGQYNPTSSLEDMANFLRTIIADMPGNVYWKDINSMYLGCNSRIVKISGLSSPDEVFGKTDEFFEKKLNWVPGTAKRFKQDDEKVINNKSSITFEDIFTQADGSQVVMLTTKSPIFNDKGEVIGILAVSLDITEQKKQAVALKIEQEKAEMASKAKSEFIANMSHDIRTPITGIAGMIQGLLNLAYNAYQQLDADKPLASAEQRQLVSTVDQYGHILMNSTNELLQLCNEILEAVSVESGKIVQTPQSFDVRELAQQALELLRPVAQDRKLMFSVTVEDSVPQYIKGLRAFLARTLLNLISNALKFTEQGFVKIQFSLSEIKHTLPHPHSLMLQITVTDSGIGIPADKFEVIFEHFSRLTPSYEGVYKGSGLGLYTVKQYVQAMYGTIDVRSQVGAGTTFTLLLPFEVSDHSDYICQSIGQLRQQRSQPKPSIEDATLTITSEKKNEALQTSQKRVLVVEDNSTAALAMKVILSSYPCTVDFAATGQEAIEKAQQNIYNLIFMDIGLPDTNGIEVTKKIRALSSPPHAQVPIVALTGHLNKKDECLEVGMQDLMTKPAQFPILDQVLQRYVFQDQVPITPVVTKTESIAVGVQQKAAALPVIEWEESLSMTGGRKPMLLHLLQLCTKELKQTQTILAEQYIKKDVRAIRAELHRCLGGICYLKLPQLDYTLKAFQTAIKREPQHIREVENTYAAVKAAIQAFFDYYRTLS